MGIFLDKIIGFAYPIDRLEKALKGKSTWILRNREGRSPAVSCPAREPGKVHPGADRAKAKGGSPVRLTAVICQRGEAQMRFK